MLTGKSAPDPTSTQVGCTLAACSLALTGSEAELTINKIKSRFRGTACSQREMKSIWRLAWQLRSILNETGRQQEKRAQTSFAVYCIKAERSPRTLI